MNLEKAFVNTVYRTFFPGESVDIRIGILHPRLDELIGGRPWAFISACNPGSVLCSDNAARHTRLIEKLDDLGYRHFPGTGIPLEGGWPPETSLLVCGIGDREAVALGLEFGQHAIVCGECGKAARLVWSGKAL